MIKTLNAPESPARRPRLSSLVFGKCCVCGQLDATPIATGEDFEYGSCMESFSALQCNRCSLVFLNPRPSKNDLDTIYPSNYHAYEFTSENYGMVHSLRRWLEARRLRHVCGDLKPGSRVLDIGCGDGFHLELLREIGHGAWHLEGLDANPRASDLAVRKGFAVQKGFLEDVALPKASFDLILLIATIEHVDDPRDFLERTRELLTRNGRVLIVTDNVSSLSFRLWRNRHWGGYHFPRHFNLFTRKTLTRLASLSGFEPDRCDTLTTPVNWVYSIRNFLQDVGAPKWVFEQFSLKTPLPLAVFTVWDYLLTCLGKGGLLRMTLKTTPGNRQ